MNKKIIFLVGLALLTAACSTDKSSGAGDGNSHTNKLMYSADQIESGQVDADQNISVYPCEDVNYKDVYEKASHLDWAPLKDKVFTRLLFCKGFGPSYDSDNLGVNVIVEVDINASDSEIQAFLNSQPTRSTSALLAEKHQALDTSIFTETWLLKGEIESKSGYTISDTYFIFYTKTHLAFMQRLASLDWASLKGRDFKSIVITTVLDENGKPFEPAVLSTQYSIYSEDPYITIDPRMTNTEIFDLLSGQLSSGSRISKLRAASHELMLKIKNKGVSVSCEAPRGIEGCISEFELLDRSDLSLMPGYGHISGYGHINVTPSSRTVCKSQRYSHIVDCSISHESNKKDFEDALKKTLDTNSMLGLSSLEVVERP